MTRDRNTVKFQTFEVCIFHKNDADVISKFSRLKSQRVPALAVKFSFLRHSASMVTGINRNGHHVYALESSEVGDSGSIKGVAKA